MTLKFNLNLPAPMTTTQTPAPQPQVAGSTSLPMINGTPLPLPLDWTNQRQIISARGEFLADCNAYHGEHGIGDELCELFVHAVNSRPALLAEVERLRAAMRNIADVATRQAAKSANADSQFICDEARAALASSAALAKGGAS